MIFFFKKSKIVVDAFTKVAGVAEFNPIEPAIKFVPDWWKSMKSTYTFRDDFGVDRLVGTIKRCDGFVALYRKGFIIPMWTDARFQSDEDGWVCSFADNMTTAMSHSSEQVPKGISDKYHHVKIDSLWYFKEKTGVQFTWQSPEWNLLDYQEQMQILPGIVDYKYQCATNINFFLTKKVNEFTIPAGTPMVHVIPVSDKDVEVRTHVVTPMEFQKQVEANMYHTKFVGSYKDRKKKIQAKGKCPFGFGR